MSKVLIIGAGGVGRVVTHKCAQVPEVFSEIWLASRTKAKCDQIASEITSTRVHTAQVDADNVPELVALINEINPVMVINVALPYQDLTIMDACLETGIHYLDTANYEPLDEAKFEYRWQWAYQDRFKDAGLTALLGSGFDPGVTNVFIAYALKHHFDQIDTVDILDCNAGDHGYPFATNFNPEINLREVTANGRYWQDGDWVETEPMEISRVFDFPEIGPRKMYLLYHEEMESLTKHIPGIQRMRFWMTFGDSYLKHLEVIRNIGLDSIEPMEFQGQQIVPIQFLKALLPDPASLGPRTVGKTNIGCIIRGTKDGKQVCRYIYNVKDHQDCYRETMAQGVSYTTGVPAMIGAKMMLEGKWKEPGVWNMEQYRHLPLPCYLLEEKKLRQNLELIRGVEQAAGCSIILALKGFAMWSAFPIVREYLSGCAASSYYEARLIDDYFRGHIHLYAPAYTKEEFPLLLELADRISFNSLGQWETFSAQALAKGISCGLRVNPGIHEVETDLYNPSGKQSRLGIAVEEIGERLPDGIEGLHVHALCESPADATARLIAAVEDSYGRYLADLKWLNLGGGHLMTRDGYDIQTLVSAIRAFRARYPHIEVILEPGSAIAWRTGPLVSSVLDIVHRGGMDIAILDISATAHMPDVLEMPYRPEVRDAGEPDEKPYTCRLGGMTCLAGDVIGDYSFDEKLKVGDLVVFEDMIHYTMVKTTMFNGVQHPAIAIERTDGSFDVVRQFSYEDYRDRLS